MRTAQCWLINMGTLLSVLSVLPALIMQSLLLQVFGDLKFSGAPVVVLRGTQGTPPRFVAPEFGKL